MCVVCLYQRISEKIGTGSFAFLFQGILPPVEMEACDNYAIDKNRSTLEIVARFILIL